jgi:hypothetical protein
MAINSDNHRYSVDEEGCSSDNDMNIDEDDDDERMDETDDAYQFVLDNGTETTNSRINSSDRLGRQLGTSSSKSNLSGNHLTGTSFQHLPSPDYILSFSPSQDYNPLSYSLTSDSHKSPPGSIPIANRGAVPTQGRHSGFLFPPPPAPALVDTPLIDDLIVNDDEQYQESLSPLRFTTRSEDRADPNTPNSMLPSSPTKVRSSVAQPVPPPNPNLTMMSSPSKAIQVNTDGKPPSFNDLVKRSTRFITSVPAFEVLEKVESVLEQYLFDKVETPIGQICKIEVHRKIYRLEVWGADTMGPPLCALQLYQLPPNVEASPSRSFLASISPSSSSFYFPNDPDSLMSGSYSSTGGQHHPLFLAEFIRGQLEIFAFKRFYQWVRQRLSELVKRDYAFKLFEQAGSPM